MSYHSEISEILREIKETLQETSRRVAGGEMRGKVKEVDPDKALVRIVIGKNPDGDEVLSPWVPYKQTAGALKVHNPPSVGQVMLIRAETGDVEQGVAEPFWWNDDNTAPSKEGDVHVITHGDVRVELGTDSLLFKLGGVEILFDGDGIHIEGGEVTHDDRNIGSDHEHTGVQSGGDLTGPPAG